MSTTEYYELVFGKGHHFVEVYCVASRTLPAAERARGTDGVSEFDMPETYLTRPVTAADYANAQRDGRTLGSVFATDDVASRYAARYNMTRGFVAAVNHV